ncbi:hypothetical protein [Thermostichus vulcanus]|uniref:DUF3301 domain-containing protein n=1 Tax=Thermostichus vulcanus str. 'Rupite' TaxID=2813851 RepID=A0ABT0CD84_THEVL|nr:hypothetical protein [Thermostichus vulcanus]MCJ2543689.1 hypothetical protein [Thermostichus vulcanus str. 'Rupite']
MSDLALLLLVLAAISFAIWSIFWQQKRSQELLQRWAAEHGYQILSQEVRYWRRGPFFWTTSRYQWVFYVRVRDSWGRERTGWVRLGDWWWGLWSDRVEDRWE